MPQYHDVRTLYPCYQHFRRRIRGYGIHHDMRTFVIELARWHCPCRSTPWMRINGVFVPTEHYEDEMRISNYIHSAYDVYEQ